MTATTSTRMWEARPVPGSMGAAWLFERTAPIIDDLVCEVEVRFVGHPYSASAATRLLIALEQFDADVRAAREEVGS